VSGTQEAQRLSRRELEIAHLIAEGVKVVIIARRLGLRQSTVNTYIQRVQWRLGLDNRDAIRHWVMALERH
jgi:DNA-binding NarL/FixJ family response regulator